jgi:hypothetical protein
MVRLRDEDIPPDERLYRRLRSSHVDGDRVLDDAVDLQGSSCDRARYRDPEGGRSVEWPELAYISPSEMPSGIRPTGKDPAWEFFAFDDPHPGNDAHCEIRVRRESRRPREESDPAARTAKPAVRAVLKYELASRMRVWRAD